MSKATVVSLFPLPIHELKPGIGYFDIKGAADKDIEVLVVPDMNAKVYIDSDRGTINMFTPGEEIARSLVDDFVGSFPSISEKVRPGIFFVPGEYTKESAKKELKDKIAQADSMQRAWGFELIRIADSEWAKFQSPRAITSLQRYFSKLYNLKRVWSEDASDSKFDIVSCKFCTEKIPAIAVVCPSCRNVLDITKYKELTAGLPAGA